MGNLIKFLVIDKEIMILEVLEVDLVVVNVCVVQVVRKCDELFEWLELMVKVVVIEDLKKCGIYLGCIIVCVSFKYWGDGEWYYKDVFVMDVSVFICRNWFFLEELFDVEY